MSKYLSLAIILLFSHIPATFAGDYMLTISDSPNTQCEKRVREIHELYTEEIKNLNECTEDLFRPICTTNEVIKSLHLYFSDKEPEIKILLAAFSNGHMEFCTENEKTKIYNALKEIQNSGKATQKRHLSDFIAILNIPSENSPSINLTE